MNESTNKVVYEITNSYHIKDDLKKAGGVFDAARKSWIITEEAFEKLNARSSSWGMAWSKGWSNAKKQKFISHNGMIDFSNPIN